MEFILSIAIIFIPILLIALAFKIALRSIKRPSRAPYVSKEVETPIYDYEYTKKDYLLTAPEHDLFDTLMKVAGDQYYIFPQVHLSTLFDHKIFGQGWRGALSHIQRKSVDFVICDKEHIKPLLAIELDDSSHDEEDRIERDEEVEGIFEQAGVPLLRFKNRDRMNIDLVSSKIRGILDSQPSK
ncbi:MAG: DUF2726 domain-containing protein [Patescibacteria group bacterium]|jgi:hypothetical protein